MRQRACSRAGPLHESSRIPPASSQQPNTMPNSRNSLGARQESHTMRSLAPLIHKVHPIRFEEVPPLFSSFFKLWQLVDIPSAPDRLDEQNAGLHPSPLDV